MLRFLIPVVGESRLIVALLETKFLEKKLEEEVPLSADGSVALNPTKHSQHVLARWRRVDLDLRVVVTKPIQVEWGSVHENSFVLLNQRILEAVKNVNFAHDKSIDGCIHDGETQ